MTQTHVLLLTLLAMAAPSVGYAIGWLFDPKGPVATYGGLLALYFTLCRLQSELDDLHGHLFWPPFEKDET